MNEEYTDHELIERFRSEDTRYYAFNLLMRKYQERIYWHIRRIVILHEDANDITQDTFVKVWKHLESFKEESQLFTWIYRIATNEALSFLRSRKNKYLIPLVQVEKRLSRTLRDDNFFKGDEIQQKLQQVILSLPEKQRIVFNLRYYDEMKYEEMAQVLNTSVGALKASYHHAVKKIEEYFRQH